MIQLLPMLKRDGGVGGGVQWRRKDNLSMQIFSPHVILFHAVPPGIYLRSTAGSELPGNGTFRLRYYYTKKIIFDQIQGFKDEQQDTCGNTNIQ